MSSCEDFRNLFNDVGLGFLDVIIRTFKRFKTLCAYQLQLRFISSIINAFVYGITELDSEVSKSGTDVLYDREYLI